MSLLLLLQGVPGAPPVAAPSTLMPQPRLKIAFNGTPRDPSALLTDVSSYLRSFRTSRGRSFEFDRMETGTYEGLLSNRDAAWNPENTQSPYYPLRPTRRLRLGATWAGVDYDIFGGFTEGYPQEYPASGWDATVNLRASDPFYPLSRWKFPPGTVFPRQTSGARIAACLSVVGLDPADADLDVGQSDIAAVVLDQQGTSPLEGTTALEHVLLIAEAENGRFFAARDGRLTFRDRDSTRRQLVSLGVFGDHAGGSGGASYGSGLYGEGLFGLGQLAQSGPEYPYAPTPSLEHDESKLFNVIRIKTASGAVVEARDQASIDEEWERTFEKDWPLADDVEAVAAAHYLLGTLGQMRLRVTEIEIRPLSNPAVMWPLVFGLELGQRWTFKMTPIGGGDPINRDVIIDGVGHDAVPDNWTLKLRLTLADERSYWRLGATGASELGATTRLGY